MFNALNRFISRLDGDPQQQRRDQPGGWGFQVLRNTNLDLTIEPWFDFIVGINGREIDNPDPRLFAQEIRNCAGTTVALGLWSGKGQRTRVLHVAVPYEQPSLGLSLQWTSLATVTNIWHVLDVPSNSPADNAGLLPYSDYILGTPDGVLLGESGLGELVEDFIGRPLKLWVYNNEYNVTRELEIVPSRDWGGEGALGCVLGYGALHRLPAPLDEPVEAPGETMFDGDGGEVTGGEQFLTISPPENSSTPAPPPGAPSTDFLVPAQIVNAETTATPARGKKKDRHIHSPNRGMDDYFAEQEKKSKELEGGSSSKSKATPPPPPPKAGGPPPPKGGPPRASPKPEESAGEE
ncbi:GRASP55/65 PDZ-like domain-containing protein [Xylariales sp. PMI_506]|nr:GRASP55/65 PDZ-like domain-containing protein [Xylariales sp. PMI_506]